MKNRILEFAKQSGLIQFDLIGTDGAVTPNHTDYAKAHRFAELIIGECANLCHDNAQSYKHSYPPKKAEIAAGSSNFCAVLIKKHFGVR